MTWKYSIKLIGRIIMMKTFWRDENITRRDYHNGSKIRSLKDIAAI